jgi:hypothetical protein
VIKHCNEDEAFQQRDLVAPWWRSGVVSLCSIIARISSNQPRITRQEYSCVLAIKPRDFSRCLTINSSFLQISTFIPRNFAYADSDFGFHLPIFPVQL